MKRVKKGGGGCSQMLSKFLGGNVKWNTETSFSLSFVPLLHVLFLALLKLFTFWATTHEQERGLGRWCDRFFFAFLLTEYVNTSPVQLACFPCIVFSLRVRRWLICNFFHFNLSAFKSCSRKKLIFPQVKQRHPHFLGREVVKLSDQLPTFSNGFVTVSYRFRPPSPYLCPP